LRRHPEELIESELFGHIKGSFTGASENKIGKFEKADGGTLFLERSRRHEPAHAVQGAPRSGGTTARAGGVEQTVSVDVRVIAATNKETRRRDRGRKDSAKISSIG